MKKFEKIKLICEENSKISSTLIDEFLLYYAAERNNLERDMDQRFANYKHLTPLLKKEWINRLKSQYIVHRVFKEDGFIKSYLNHPELKKLDKESRIWLEFQTVHPWRFSFSVIKESPAENFFVMEDVFTDEEYLLFSPGVAKTLEEQSVILWFNLISNNGACWQSFGPIGAYNSFEPDDIFFFATELEPEIADDEELMANVESNPLPYMMLISGSRTPLIFSKNNQIVQAMAEYDLDSIDTKKLKKSFKTEYNEGVYRLSLKRWSGSPHFAQAYYNENDKIMLLSSMTDKGFQALAEGLNVYGYDFYTDPFLRVNLSMITTASDILKRTIRLNDYEDLFSKETSPSEKENVDNLNKFLGLIMPDINAGREPDIKAMALKAGVDIQTAQNIIKQLMEKLKHMGGGTKKD